MCGTWPLRALYNLSSSCWRAEGCDRDGQNSLLYVMRAKVASQLLSSTFVYVVRVHVCPVAGVVSLTCISNQLRR